MNGAENQLNRYVRMKKVVSEYRATVRRSGLDTVLMRGIQADIRVVPHHPPAIPPGSQGLFREICDVPGPASTPGHVVRRSPASGTRSRSESTGVLVRGLLPVSEQPVSGSGYSPLLRSIAPASGPGVSSQPRR